MAVIHWNSQGFSAKLDDLNILISDLNPPFIALQESLCSESFTPSIRHFTSYNTCTVGALRASGGVTTLISNTVPQRQIILNTNLQAHAVNVTLHRTFTICNLYLPPNKQVSYQELHDLISQLPPPFLLLGDFNAHNPLWGSGNLDSKGKSVEKLIDQHNLCLFNTKHAKTHLHLPTGNLFSIDLSICSPTLFLDFNWSVCSDLYNSDHYPVILKSPNNVPENRIPRFRFADADWDSFKSLVSKLSLDSFQTPDPITKFANEITKIMNLTIPKTSSNPSLKPKKPVFLGVEKVLVLSANPAPP